MKPENFESRLPSWRSGTAVVIRTNGRELWLSVEGEDGRGHSVYLTPSQVHELKAMIANWERFYYDGIFEPDDPPAWACGQDPYRCEDCGSLIREDLSCPRCDAVPMEEIDPADYEDPKPSLEDVRQACEAAANAIADLHPDRWLGWVAYILEALEDYAGSMTMTDVLTSVRDAVDGRLEREGW